MMLEADKALGLLALLAIALRLGWVVHRRSAARQAIHGGAMSRACNYLSATCFTAILPTALMTVLFLHPSPIELAGMVWSPLLLAVVSLGAGSLVFALLHAVFERNPALRAAAAHQESRGWTEQDARTSGL